jgi:hypothetical protein
MALDMKYVRITPAMQDIKLRLNRRMTMITCLAGSCKVQTIRIRRRTTIKSVRVLLTPVTKRDQVWLM